MDIPLDLKDRVARLEQEVARMRGETHSLPRAVLEGCRCQGCGRHFRVDVLVPDEIWNRIRPMDKPLGGGLLCGPCILMGIEGMCELAAYRLVKS